MAAAFSAVLPSSSGTGHDFGGVAETWTQSLTVGASITDLVLILAESQAYSVIDTFTWNSVSATRIDHRESNDNTGGGIQVWWMANPSAATANALIHHTGGNTGAELIAITVTGGAATTPTTHNNAGASGSATDTINSQSGSLVINGACNGSAITSASAGTQRGLLNRDTASAAGNLGVSTSAGASSVTSTWTTTSDWWASISVNIQAAGGGGGGGAQLAKVLVVPAMAVVRAASW